MDRQQSAPASVFETKAAVRAPQFGEAQLVELFTYHPPTDVQRDRYVAIRNGALAFARILVANTPAGADRSAAMRHLRECVMTANAAVALEGKL